MFFFVKPFSRKISGKWFRTTEQIVKFCASMHRQHTTYSGGSTIFFFLWDFRGNDDWLNDPLYVCIRNSTRLVGTFVALRHAKKKQMKMMATILEGHKPNKTSTNKHLHLVPTSTHLQTLIFYRNYTYLHTYLNLMKCPNRC